MGSTNKIYEFDAFRLDATERRLFKGDDLVVLPAKAFDILVTLVEGKGHLVEKEALYRRIWGGRIVEDANIAVQVSAIRKALGSPDYVGAVRGHGYRFNAAVRECDGSVSSLITRESSARAVVENGTEMAGDPPPAQPGTTPGQPAALKSTTAALKATLLVTAGTAAVLLAVWLAYFLHGAGTTVAPARLPFQNASIRKLTTNGKVGQVASSPDGKMIAYVAEGRDGRSSLKLAQVDGSRELTLLDPADGVFLGIAFAPDGKEIYFAKSRRHSPGKLFRMPVLGGAPTLIAEGFYGHLAFSPDGKRLAFVRNGGGKSMLWTASLDGTNQKAVISRAAMTGFSPTAFAWSPDGRSIAVAAASGDGEHQEIYMVGVANGSMSQLTRLGWKRHRGLAWLKDGSGLIDVAIDTGSLFNSRVWHISYPSGDASRIINDLNVYGYAFDLSYDGDRGSLAMIQAQHQSNLWIAPAEALAKPTQITFDSLARNNGWTGFDWLPDGRIVYSTREKESETFWIMNADGSGGRQILPPGSANSYPSVTHDGSYLIFESDRSGSTEVWRLDLHTGGEPVQLTHGGRNSQPHASPVGDQVVYTSRAQDRTGLWRMPVNGGEPVLLEEDTTILGGRISPDGRLVAYGQDANGELRISVVTIDGGAPLVQFGTPASANLNLGVRWSPDGKFICYRDWHNGYWSQSLAGGEPTRIEGLPTEKLYAFDWSRDGRSFAFVRGGEITDVVLITDAK